MPAEKFTPEDLEDAADDLAMLEYWRPDMRAAVKLLLGSMCPHKEALEWLVLQLVTRVGKWPGPAEVRGILCWKYDAADGIDAYSSLPGFTPADGEVRHYEVHKNLKAGGWERDRLSELLPERRKEA